MSDAPLNFDPNKQIIDVWYEIYYPILFDYALARLSLDEDAAAECVYKTLEAARKKVAHLKKHDNVGGWMMNALKKEILIYHRSSKTRLRYYRIIFNKFLIQDDRSFETWSDDMISDDEIIHMKESIIHTLNAVEQELYHLYYEKEKTIKEAAMSLGITEGAAKMRLARLRNKITDRVKNIF